MMDVTTRCTMARAILERTNDGDDLDPLDLHLLERAVNGFLDDTGCMLFQMLHDIVMEGYILPWFHGVEHLTIDNQGYVYWKKVMVEHYTLHWAYSEQAKTEAIELGRRCRILEQTHTPVSNTTVIWKWNEASA